MDFVPYAVPFFIALIVVELLADRWRGPWAPGNPSPKGLKESPLGGRDGGGHHEGAAEAQLLTIARNCLKDVPAA